MSERYDLYLDIPPPSLFTPCYPRTQEPWAPSKLFCISVHEFFTPSWPCLALCLDISMHGVVPSVFQERLYLFSVQLFRVGIGWPVLGFYMVAILFPRFDDPCPHWDLHYSFISIQDQGRVIPASRSSNSDLDSSLATNLGSLGQIPSLLSIIYGRYGTGKGGGCRPVPASWLFSLFSAFLGFLHGD